MLYGENMEMFDLKIIVSIFIALLGWIVGHKFNSWRDLKSKRREISIQHLITAYRVLVCEISHRKATPDNRIKLENILSDIQLFGNNEQINFAKDLSEEVAAGSSFELDPLINSLREDLREQLRLKPVKGNVKWLRFKD